MAVVVLNKLIAKDVQGELNWGNNEPTIQTFKNILRFIHNVCKANCDKYTEKIGNDSLKNALKNARSAIK